ncbi:MAG TPA: asparaginase [Gemmatimonadaceae bacterium]|nr:asparaginase [Gemmatimonadaceae bacterium]
MRLLQLDVAVRRGPIVESVHRVHAAVVDASGTLRAAARQSDRVTSWRSCAKPFQVMPLLQSGHFDSLGWGTDELALACASHGGEPEHVSLARAMLERLDLEEGDLACGPHDPLSRRGARALQQNGDRPTRLHNNCSGKHAAMLALAKGRGSPVRGYEAAMHPVQQCILENIARWSGTPSSSISLMVDGCGVVAFGLSLEPMARAFARWGEAAERGEEPSARIVAAMRERPFLVGGTDRFDTVLIEETQGAVVTKVGAEGMHCGVVPHEGIGFSLKVEDGAQRAQHAAVIRLLQHLGVLGDPVPPRLEAFLNAPVLNTRGEHVGDVSPVA